MNAFDITLVGLPGSGKKTAKTALLKQGGGKVVIQNLPVIQPQMVLNTLGLVVDVRFILADAEGLDLLASIASQASFIIFSFTEQAELDAQSFWQKWVVQCAINKPVYRLFYGEFKTRLSLDKWQKLTLTACRLPVSEPLQYAVFSLQTVQLEHLLAALDACQKNLGMVFWRIKGSMQTTEYQNPIQIEGTLAKIETYGAELDSHQVAFWGRNLDKVFIKQIVQAAQL